MAIRKNRAFAKLATNVDADGDVTTTGLASDITADIAAAGTVVYDSAALLPISGNTAGDTAFVKSTSRLYIHSGVGWYNVAVINNTPTVQSITDSGGGTTPFALATDGTPTTITITAQDSDGDPLTYNYSADSNFGGLATLSQDANVFTITPFSQDSASTTSGTITFTVTDGINTATPGIQTFTLNFLSPYWDETVLSIGTSSTNSLGNSTFIDRSTNAHTVTPTGSPVQTAFHPYLDKWSVEFDGSSSYIHHDSGPAMDTDIFTWEAWIWWDGSAEGAVLATDTNPSNSGPIAMTLTSAGKLDFARHYYGNTQSTALVPANQWTHIAVERSGSTVNLYIDGTQEVKSVGASEDYNIDGYYIGQYIAGDKKFPGYISNVRIVRGSLVYNTSSFTPSSDPLTAITGTELLTCQSNRFIDNSSNGYSLAAYGAPKVSAFNPFGQLSEYTSGANKGSVSLNGNNGLSTTQINLGNGDFNVEGWMFVDPSDTTVGGIIVGTHDVGVATGWYLSVDGTNIYWGRYSGSQGDTSVAHGIPGGGVGSWNHFAVSRSSGTTSIYCNGTRLTNISDTDNYTTGAGATTIGIDVALNAAQIYGYVSDVKVCVGTAIYTGASYTVPTAPVGNTNASLYLPMDNAGIFDKTGNSTLTLAGNTATSTTQTKFASTSMYFDGSGDYITTDFPALGTGDFTIEFWINPSTINSAFKALIDPRVSNANNPLVWIRNNNVIYYYANNADAIIGTTTLSTGTWYHVAVSRSSGTTKLFLNGTQEGSDYSDTTSYTADTLYIGQRFTAGPYNYHGYMENLQILPGVAKYTANFTPPTSTQGRSYQAED